MGSTLIKGIVTGALAFMSVAPSSSNYSLKAYEFGTGGEDNLSSTNYRLNGLTGQQANGRLSSVSYVIGSGETPTQNTNITAPPTVTNPSNYYNQLRVILDTGNNPSDTRYLIAVSDNSFATTYYVQTDNSIGTSLSITNYQTYASWGGASGFLLLGLKASTTYQVKVKALQGNFTESAYSSTASAATVAPSISLSVTTTASPTPPFNVFFSSLASGTVYAADADINITFSTNAVQGGDIYTRSTNGGLVSSSAATTITSASTNLGSAQDGYGAQVTSTSQSSGGPFNAESPYAGSGDNVGALATTLQRIVRSSSAITAGSATVRLKAKTTATTPSSNDYSDTLTFVATALF